MATRERRSSAAIGRRATRVDALKTKDASSDPIADDLAAIMNQGVDGLRAVWAQRFHCNAPPIQSADVLRRIFAWRIQVEAFGDLDAATALALKRGRGANAKGKTPIQSTGKSLRNGTILVREWHGVAHRVLTLDKGFEHDGKRYGSLSEVARAISGTHWSGPRFFGIEARPKRDLKSASSGEVSI